MTRHDSWIVVGVSGVTCGGKTTLANRLIQHVRSARVFHQDKYFLPDDHPAHIPVPGLDEPHNNYDILSALDMKQMLRDVSDTLSGNDRCHAVNDPAAASYSLAPGRTLLVVEGFTALNYRPLYDLCDLRYYLTLSYSECVSRRSLRLYSPPDVSGYFDTCVWPQHVHYRTEMESLGGVSFLDGTDPDIFDKVIADLRRFGLRDIDGANSGQTNNSGHSS